MSGMKRDVSHTEDNTTVIADDAVSTTSGVMREKEIKDSASKVQQFLDTNHHRSQKSSSMMRSTAQIGGENRGRHHRVNYNSQCDLDRFEKFKATMLQLAGVKKLAKLLATVIKEM